MLSEIGQLTEVETNPNQLLSSSLPRHLLKGKLPMAIDITELPYHGQYDDEDETGRRSKAKSGMSHFFAFAPLYVVLMHSDEKAYEGVERLLKRGGAIGLAAQAALPRIAALIIMGWWPT